MEKLMYLLWKPRDQPAENFRDNFITHTVPALAKFGAKQIRLDIADSDVTSADRLRITSTQLQNSPFSPDGLLSFWLNSANDRQETEALLQHDDTQVNGYLVTESEPLPNTHFPSQDGQRTTGMNQVVLLRTPSRLTRSEWLELWLNSHTRIAIETQSTFGYRQNLVVRPLTDNALTIDAIVEENFPAEAMMSAHAFYRAIGDDALLRKHRSDMFASVQRFIDLDQIDCLPMSEYNF